MDWADTLTDAGLDGLGASELMAAVMSTRDGAADPYRFLDRLHAHGEAARTDDYAIAFSHAACTSVFKSRAFGRQSPDPSVSRTVFNRQLTADQERQLRDEGSKMPVQLPFIDGPDHSRQRNLVSRAFTPNTLARLRSLLADYLDREVIPAIKPGEPFDFVRHIAIPFPTFVIGALVGLPVEDREHVRDLVAAWVREREPTADFDMLLASAHAIRELETYMRDLIEERRRHPSDDLASALIQAEEAGDRLSTGELIAMITLLFVGGYETTTNMLSNLMRDLIDHPDQLRLLQQDPPLLSGAVNESLRLNTVVIVTPYFAKVDTSVAGIEVPAGTGVLQVLGAANRDPRVFSQPATFDIHRNQAPPLLSFGNGPHYCLGASLARLEADTAFDALLRRFTRFELAEPAPERLESFTFRGYSVLSVVAS
jgi:cytochrome P450